MKNTLTRTITIVLLAVGLLAPTAALASISPYYINSSGIKTHVPVKAEAVPKGASAKCRDGSFSFSAHRRGTCSHHGGVKTWL